MSTTLRTATVRNLVGGLLLGALVLGLAGSAAGDVVVNSSGTVVDWGLTPFTQANQANAQSGNLAWTISNNYSPIDYAGLGHVPSPGGSAGELFDLDEMYMRVSGSNLQVLLVTSGYVASTSGYTLHLGDLFVTVDGHQYGVVTQSANQGLAAGSVYALSGAGDIQILENAAGSYINYTALRPNDYGPDAAVRDVAGPWAVKSGISSSQLLGQATIDTANFNYGGAESGTFLIQYTVDLGTLGGQSFLQAEAHSAWGCGNDVIETAYVNSVPEPATMALVGLGTLGLFIRRRR